MLKRKKGVVKKTLCLMIPLVMMTVGMNTQAFATNAENEDTGRVVIEAFDSTSKENVLNTSNSDDIQTITVDQDFFKNSTSKKDIPEERSGYQLNSIRGTVTGELTPDDPWDYYVFTKNTEFKGLIEFKTNQSAYTLTLGLADYTTGQISLSNIVLSPGDRYMITFSPLPSNQDYAWVVQSKNTPSGASYSFKYDNDYNDAFYTAPNGDEYAVRNQKMYLNDSLVNLDYRYDVSFQTPYGYQERHIWVEDMNVYPVFVGSVEWYASKQRQYYDNVIVLTLLPGGTFTHHFYQNPPLMNWGYSDAFGIKTPRALTSDDFTYRGDHILVYDIDQGKTIQFVSGLSANWHKYAGDLHDFKFLKGEWVS